MSEYYLGSYFVKSCLSVNLFFTLAELCRANAGIPLKDQDTTSRRDGEWMKINTLGHFNILEMVSTQSVCFLIDLIHNRLKLP